MARKGIYVAFCGLNCNCRKFIKNCDRASYFLPSLKPLLPTAATLSLSTILFRCVFPNPYHPLLTTNATTSLKFWHRPNTFSATLQPLPKTLLTSSKFPPAKLPRYFWHTTLTTSGFLTCLEATTFSTSDGMTLTKIYTE